MALDAQAVTGAARDQRAQIDAPKADPNATPASKQQLDAWLQQMEAAWAVVGLAS